MISKRIIAVSTFDNGILTRTQNLRLTTLIHKICEHYLFDGIVLIDISKNNKTEINFIE